MTGGGAAHVVIAAGGLGTRVACWARFIPKEFYPVDGRPGVMHLLEELAALGPARVVIVYHPYYEGFAAWARHALSEHGQAGYARAAHSDFGAVLQPGLAISFVPQQGPYADLTSVINGADHLACPAELYVAFADNLYGQPGPLLALRDAAPGQVAVLARSYRPQLAASRGVIATTGKPGQRLMIGLAEKPGPAQAQAMERRYGHGNLFLLDGRTRLTAAFVQFARIRTPPARTEPKLALTIAAYATSHPVHIIETGGDVTDLGALAASHPDRAPSAHDSGPRRKQEPASHSTWLRLPDLRHRGRHRAPTVGYRARNAR